MLEYKMNYTLLIHISFLPVFSPLSNYIPINNLKK